MFSSAGSELQHQVSERVALFLHKYNKESDKLLIFKTIKSCYSIRSKYVHGDVLEKKYKTFESLQDKSSEIDEICRKVMNIFIENDLSFFNDTDLTDYFLGLLFNND